MFSLGGQQQLQLAANNTEIGNSIVGRQSSLAKLMPIQFHHQQQMLQQQQFRKGLKRPLVPNPWADRHQQQMVLKREEIAPPAVSGNQDQQHSAGRGEKRINLMRQGGGEKLTGDEASLRAEILHMKRECVRVRLKNYDFIYTLVINFDGKL